MGDERWEEKGSRGRRGESDGVGGGGEGGIKGEEGIKGTETVGDGVWGEGWVQAGDREEGEGEL